MYKELYTLINIIVANKNYDIEKLILKPRLISFAFRYKVASQTYNSISIVIVNNSFNCESITSAVEYLKFALTWKQAFS